MATSRGHPSGIPSADSRRPPEPSTANTTSATRYDFHAVVADIVRRTRRRGRPGRDAGRPFGASGPDRAARSAPRSSSVTRIGSRSAGSDAGRRGSDPSELEVDERGDPDRPEEVAHHEEQTDSDPEEHRREMRRPVLEGVADPAGHELTDHADDDRRQHERGDQVADAPPGDQTHQVADG